MGQSLLQNGLFQRGKVKELQVKGVIVCDSACTIIVDLAASMQVKTFVGWEIA
jgi:hypothetical protein